MERWQHPPCDWGGPTAWRLFNCVTREPTGRIAENPSLTRRLHEVIDAVSIDRDLGPALLQAPA